PGQRIRSPPHRPGARSRGNNSLLPRSAGRMNCNLPISLAVRLPSPAKYVEAADRISAAFARTITNERPSAGLAMRVVIPVALVSLVACAFVPRYAAQMLSAAREATVVAKPHPEPATAQASIAGSRTVVIAPSRGGHFRVNGRIDGRRIDFMVDTGASLIAL